MDLWMTNQHGETITDHDLAAVIRDVFSAPWHLTIASQSRIQGNWDHFALVSCFLMRTISSLLNLSQKKRFLKITNRSKWSSKKQRQ
jgi:hypothetical protein